MNPFEKALAASRKMGERNDCSVIATSVITGEKYEKVHGIYSKLGRFHGKCIKGTVIESVMTEHFKKKLLVFETKDIFGKRFRIESTEKYMGSNLITGSGKWLGLTYDHIFAIIDGKVYDFPEASHKIVKYLVRVT